MQLVSLLFSSMHSGSDYLMLQWALGLTVFSIPIAVLVGKRSSDLIGLVFLYITAWSVFSVFNFTHNYWLAPEQIRKQFAQSAAITYIGFALVLLSVCAMKTKSLVKIIHCLPWFALINSVYVIAGCALGFGRPIGSLATRGLVDYPGLNGILIVMSAAPLALGIVRHAWLVDVAVLLASTIAVALSKSSIPYGVAACIWVGYLFSSSADIKRFLLKSALAVPAIFSIGLAFEGRNLFNSAQRFEAYRVFMSDWWDYGFQLLGTGPGSFTVLSPIIQCRHGFMCDLANKSRHHWPWLHSDILQALFEFGILFWVMAIAIAVIMLVQLYKKRESELFALFCGVIGASLFDYGFRYFPTALIFTTIIIIAARTGARPSLKNPLSQIVTQ